MEGNLIAWVTPIVSGLAAAIVFLYKRQSDAETKRAERAETRADALQQAINNRAAESERIAQDAMRENAGLRADMDALKRSVENKGQPS